MAGNNRNSCNRWSQELFVAKHLGFLPRTLQINNDNQVPIVQISEPLDMDLIRASEDTIIQGVARDNDGQVTRVEIEIFDLASGYVLNSGPNPVTNFAPNGAWSTVWDTSDLIHDQQYELVVRAYDGEDYSAEVRNRIIIDNPTDLNNMPPIFNDTGWASTLTIFCDAQSSSIDRCGSGAVIDLTKYFSDPDGIGSTAEALAFDIYDDLSNLDDDDYGWLFTISAQGVATYNPTTRSDSTVSEWSCHGAGAVGGSVGCSPFWDWSGHGRQGQGRGYQGRCRQHSGTDQPDRVERFSRIF